MNHTDPQNDTAEQGVSSLVPPKRASLRKSRIEALMKSLTDLQKRLRLVAESDGEFGQIGEPQLVQLRLVKTEIDRFFGKILSPSSDE